MRRGLTVIGFAAAAALLIAGAAARLMTLVAASLLLTIAMAAWRFFTGERPSFIGRVPKRSSSADVDSPVTSDSASESAPQPARSSAVHVIRQHEADSYSSTGDDLEDPPAYDADPYPQQPRQPAASAGGFDFNRHPDPEPKVELDPEPYPEHQPVGGVPHAEPPAPDLTTFTDAERGQSRPERRRSPRVPPVKAPDAPGLFAAISELELESLPIENYDVMTVAQILPALRGLSVEELELVELHERRGRNRASVLKRIDELCSLA